MQTCNTYKNNFIPVTNYQDLATSAAVDTSTMVQTMNLLIFALLRHLQARLPLITKGLSYREEANTEKIDGRGLRWQA